MSVVDQNYVPQHAPKSEAAHALGVSLALDAERNPIGTAAGDQRYLGMPTNYKIPTARIYVINHSRTKKWKRVVIPVSFRRGAEEAILADKNLKQMYTTELVYKQVSDQGRDMNRYKEEIFPVGFKLRVPGRPNQRGGCEPSYDRIILPADTPEDKPLAYEVPEGTWDLYLGNYERMQGIVRDNSDKIVERGNASIISSEAARLGNFWSRRHNPVFKWTDDGVSQDYTIGGQPNPFGFLEFVRVPVQTVTEPIDREFLTAIDIAEAT